MCCSYYTKCSSKYINIYTTNIKMTIIVVLFLVQTSGLYAHSNKAIILSSQE